jgi:pilus assembly protein CpaC
LATRRVQTQVELESGQSFVIAGLLNNTITDTLDKIPGIGDIPLLGKLFQSRSRTRSNSELMVLITPELVRPIPVGMPLPQVHGPQEFLPGTATGAPQTPGPAANGPVPLPPARTTLPLEEMLEIEKQKTVAQAPPQASPPAGTAPGGIR